MKHRKTREDMHEQKAQRVIQIAHGSSIDGDDVKKKEENKKQRAYWRKTTLPPPRKTQPKTRNEKHKKEKLNEKG